MTEGILSPLQPEDFNKKDTGHDQLITDLKELLEMAGQNKYHDFKSDIPMPKMALRAHLDQIIARLMNGWYDNTPQ